MASRFATVSAHYLRETYLPRIETALETLPADRLWWRPHEDTTSVGNLLLHLEGNVRQWILSGLGGAPDGRERAAEFAAREGDDAGRLLAALRATLEAAATTIEALEDADLERGHRIQGFEVNGLEAVYHVVEHVSWHAGQITWMAKLHAGEGHGLAFYDEDAVNRARNPDPTA